MKMDREGKISPKLVVRGIVLTRRDNAPITRNLYKQIVMMLFDGAMYHDIVPCVVDYIFKLCTRSFPIEDFVITKSVKNMSDYVVDDLSTADTESRLTTLREKNCSTVQEYMVQQLPSQAQLACRMSDRGNIVDAGSRIEYVVAYPNVPFNGKLGAKLENLEYFCDHSDVLRIDWMYYTHLLANPIDQLTLTMFNKPIVSFIEKTIVQKHRMHSELLMTMCKYTVISSGSGAQL